MLKLWWNERFGQPMMSGSGSGSGTSAGSGSGVGTGNGTGSGTGTGNGTGAGNGGGGISGGGTTGNGQAGGFQGGSDTGGSNDGNSGSGTTGNGQAGGFQGGTDSEGVDANNSSALTGSVLGGNIDSLFSGPDAKDNTTNISAPNGYYDAVGRTSYDTDSHGRSTQNQTDKMGNYQIGNLHVLGKDMNWSWEDAHDKGKLAEDSGLKASRGGKFTGFNLAGKMKSGLANLGVGIGRTALNAMTGGIMGNLMEGIALGALGLRGGKGLGNLANYGINKASDFGRAPAATMASSMSVGSSGSGSGSGSGEKLKNPQEANEDKYAGKSALSSGPDMHSMLHSTSDVSLPQSMKVSTAVHDNEVDIFNKKKARKMAISDERLKAYIVRTMDPMDGVMRAMATRMLYRSRW